MNYKNQNPEQIARDKIDALLEQAGWKVQSIKKMDLKKIGPGMAFGDLILNMLMQYTLSIKSPNTKPDLGCQKVIKQIENIRVHKFSNIKDLKED